MKRFLSIGGQKQERRGRGEGGGECGLGGVGPLLPFSSLIETGDRLLNF